MESEQGRYVCVDVEGCDVSNNPYSKDPIESSPIQYQLAPLPQFENVFSSVVSSNWTPWVNPNTGNSSEDFVVDQVFNFKVAL